MKSGQMAGVNKKLQSACGERAPVSWLTLTPLLAFQRAFVGMEEQGDAHLRRGGLQMKQ